MFSISQCAAATTQVDGRMVSGWVSSASEQKGVRLHVSGVGTVGQGELKSPEEEGPTGLSRVQPLG